MELTRREFIKSSLLLGGSLFAPNAAFYTSNNKGLPWFPAYGKLESEGKLAQRIQQAYAIFEECELCPRRCGTNRLNGEQGFCRATAKPMLYSSHPHFGEELSLVGKEGSGTIFFSNCNLRCVFCQNWPISHKGYGKEVTDEALADIMLHLQKIGCHNINLVTPTHVMPNILNATGIAFKKGLRLPLVYNTSGYERFEILNILDGIVDIYLPDMKFMDADQSEKYLGKASDYPKVSQKAVIEMHRQVGLHQADSRGIAVRGLMIRHLVMPNRVAGTEKFIRWVAENLPKTTYINIMHQYAPDYEAFDYPEIWRRINVQEYLEAMRWADAYGLTNLDPVSLKIRKFYEKQNT
ncbi:MAG: radical SAM protein [Pseudomonadota bacterium]|uniref:Radical SAM protein n=1 Tax=Candidatus Desulfatibia profunda TaxID=2841695 RepID=A0A8J6TGM1_9BACT|nr:radical SAM protein [Candidatus Desulfatibia profunda]MBL7179916.1 radical SAM protein [Desulfobacterales bacterium]